MMDDQNLDMQELLFKLYLYSLRHPDLRERPLFRKLWELAERADAFYQHRLAEYESQLAGDHNILADDWLEQLSERGGYENFDDEAFLASLGPAAAASEDSTLQALDDNSDEASSITEDADTE